MPNNGSRPVGYLDTYKAENWCWQKKFFCIRKLTNCHSSGFSQSGLPASNRMTNKQFTIKISPLVQYIFQTIGRCCLYSKKNGRKKNAENSSVTLFSYLTSLLFLKPHILSIYSVLFMLNMSSLCIIFFSLPLHACMIVPLIQGTRPISSY